MDYLCELPNDAARRVALGSLPPDLTSTYERILSRVNQGNAETQKLVRRALRWIANDEGYSGLTVGALCEAISIDLGSTRRNPEAIPDDYAILQSCSSLVRKSESGEKLELAHFTVKEFLRQIDPQRDLSIGAYRYDPRNDKLILAKVCLTYLMFDDFDQGGPLSVQTSTERFQKNPFRRHAVSRWHHVAQDNLGDTELFALIQKLLNPSKPNTLISWAQDLMVYPMEWGYNENDEAEAEKVDSIIESGLAEATPLHYAAMLGLTKVCDWLIGSGCDVDRNTKFGTPLHCALLGEGAFFGRFLNPLEELNELIFASWSLETVRTLLEAGADSNCCYHSETKMLSPLFIAFWKRDFDHAMQLLDRGAILDSNCLDELESDTYDASDIAGHISEHNLQQGDNTRLIRLAMSVEKCNATRLMELSNGLPSQNLHYEQCLRTFSQYGQVQMVIDLLEVQKLDVNAADGNTGLTALHHAAKADQLGVVQVLLDSGADWSRLDNLKRTALHHCVLSGETHCLQFFLQKGADTRNQDLEGMTIWHLAAQEGNLGALSVLLSMHAELAWVIGLETNDGSNAIHYAVTVSPEKLAEILGFLFDNGADPCKARSDGCTPLHILVDRIKDESNEYDEDDNDQLFAAGVTLMKKILENSGSASDLRLGSELIYLACSRSFLLAHEVVLSFLNLDLELNVRFADGRTALMAAAERRNDGILEALLFHGADPCIADDSGFNAIHFACFNGHESILVLLRNTSIDWNKESTATIMGCAQRKKVTPLHIAAQSLDSRVLEYLLGEGLTLNIDACTDNGETPLSVAVWRSAPKNVSLLLSKGADTTVIDNDGHSAVHWAAGDGFEEVISEFIKNGSNLGLPDSTGLTPELVARKHGHEVLAKTIMDYVNEQSEPHSTILGRFPSNETSAHIKGQISPLSSRDQAEATDYLKH